jgi:Raf kinase inhibitor-like YbhB/YbcL family protein
MTIIVTSTAFSEGEPIPVQHTGEGEDRSPPLAFSGVPESARELVLICEDPDAPTPQPWVHWVIYKLAPDLPGLPEGIDKKPRLKNPPGAFQGKNSWPAGQTIGYRGPMPPPGHGVHRYFFRLLALEAKLPVEPGLDKATLLQEISGHIIDEGELIGTYER